VTWVKVFSIVTIGALLGMVMGALFGFAAGSIAPRFFSHLIPWNDIEPRGIGTVLGGIAGVLLGGGLAVFGLLVQAVAGSRYARRD
jgi:hypothetical protein